MYAPDKPFTVYCSKCWWGDNWDALAYGRDYDFSRPFFDQFYELMRSVPLVNRFVYEDTVIRSDYTNMARDLKDCYLIFHGDYCERCLYSDQIDHSNDCVDVSYTTHSELCYESVNLHKNYRVFFSKDSEACHDCYFIRDCIGCSSCFGCVNLRNKQYYLFNKPYSRDSYLQKLGELGFNSKSYVSLEHFRTRAREHWLQFPVKFMHGTRNSKVSGDYIYNSKNVFTSFDVRDVEDSKFCAHLVVKNAKDSYDWTQYGENGEQIYECLQAGGGIYHNRFGWCIWRGARDIEYGILNVNSVNCFGCISIKNKQYCILNKQYSESEYWKLREHIIHHMNESPYEDKRGRIYRYGEFFPVNLSPFGYNETFAYSELPLKASEALEAGYNWTEIEKYRGKYEVTMSILDLPDTIGGVTDSILNEVVPCAACNRPYQIIPQELEFYRNLALPLPHLCFECRYKRRIEDKNPSRLWRRPCACGGETSDNGTYINQNQHFHNPGRCPNEFETSYEPRRPEIVYCEACYQAEVV